MAALHLPVLLEAVIEGLDCRRRAGLYLDCTLGGGGHSRGILAANPANRVIGIDRDRRALELARRNLRPFGDRVRLLQGDFRDLSSLLAGLGVGGVDGVLADLGVSSFQLAEAGRGFSFRADGPLDMRMDQREGGLTAARLVNELSADRLREIFRKYGQERYAGAIAAAIVRSRAHSPITSTRQLVAVMEKALPPAYRHGSGIHFATRVFQALRIAVNEELSALEAFLPAAVEVLNGGGRLAIISFHSLEDKMVKAFFRHMSAACHCPPRVPRCVCNAQPRLRLITRKPIVADEKQVRMNPRARSARLRLAQKLEG